MSQPKKHLKEQSLIEHLRELRKRIVYSFIFIFIATIGAWAYSDILFDLVRAPISPYLWATNGGLSFTGPMEQFMGYIKVSLLGGAIISCPFWLHQIWLFLAPGLYSNERKFALGFIFSGSFLFAMGVTFAYLVALPFVFKFLMDFGGRKDQAIITINEYLSFFIKTIMLFGLSFEMPLVLTFLGMMGVVTHQFLAQKRRYAILILSIVSAVLTPPDPLSMVMMLVPLYTLYEISIISVRLVQKSSSVKEEEQYS